MGILDDAGVSIADAPSDPFGFGRDYWPVQILAVGEPKLTANQDKFGMMITWTCIHPDKSDMEKLGNGNWQQLPMPKAYQQELGITVDPKSSDVQKILFQLKKLYEALGFSADEMNSIEANDLVGRQCMAKIFVKQNDEGFWQFNVTALKQMPSEGFEGLGEFAQSSKGGKSAEDLLAEEMKNA